MSGLMANKELSSVISLTIIILLPIISRTNINVSAYAAVAQAEIPANKAEVSNLLGSKNVEMPANIPSPILINDRKRSIQDASFANDPGEFWIMNLENFCLSFYSTCSLSLDSWPLSIFREYMMMMVMMIASNKYSFEQIINDS